ncbi:hypothetical protein GLAREA_10965 [Glarea lozoyensis ATCC 20868]|uniref:Uncharacterized protein n=1 Tax=Glarea lozoyensis (strain ATCC 20868 / MF5171) TaxID=1116229 RepID=S3EAC5_GLAL2|nr:uncharacterized protein GLAREA_10965 [Glarea lozoyensis ATCC 20868]EPE35268.1 hypothetical protein GLAREA_10965 [Glarea lozoyensis ATCC 20868]
MDAVNYLTAAIRNTAISIFNPILESEPSEPFSPTADDVVEVKKFFLESAKLPLELVDAIIDQAEYWPHTRSVFHRHESENPLYVRAGGVEENSLLLRTPPLGFMPLQEWTHAITKTSTDTPRKLTTDVGPELEGTGRYAWNLEGAPLISESAPGEVGDDELTKKVLKGLGDDSASRGLTCRKIVFTIRSHDQGWGGSSAADRGTYRGSFTWFDVGLERVVAKRQDDESGTSNSQNPIVLTTRQILPHFSPSQEPEFPLLPGRTCLQKNLTASNTWQDHVIEWRATDNIHEESPEADALEEQGRGRASLDGEFVRNLKIGDAITVWGKARFGGWSNIITDVNVDVYWAV